MYCACQEGMSAGSAGGCHCNEGVWNEDKHEC